MIYPNEGERLTFSNPARAFKVPVIGFCDFESVLQRNRERKHCQKCNKLDCECNVSSSEPINIHKAIGYSILFVDSNDKVFFQEEYAGTDCVKHFYNRLGAYQRAVDDHKQAYRLVKDINTTKKDWKAYHKAVICHICKEPFEESAKKTKVIDHDHVTGKMIGAAHSICNLQRQGPFRTPIFFHNAQG